ncbi:MAG TPA: radical SAM protein [Anaeromyxobacter sp.]
MANLGYVQVTRACNQTCRFCSNPPSGLELDLEEARRRVDDLAARRYDGVILTGGEPTLVPWLPELVAHAAARGLAPRVITNGQRLAEGPLLDALVAAGLRHLHVSLYSHDPAVHDGLTRNPGSHGRALATLARATARPGLAVDVNCVIHRQNAGSLDLLAELVTSRFPRVRHLVFNNLDARMNRVAENPDTIPRLSDLELSLARALRLLEARGVSFRVERVPLCYMAEWAHCSTETRKLVKAEERTVHFLDAKGVVRQEAASFVHARAPACAACRVAPVCAGLDGLGEWHDGAELYPLFLDPEEIAARVRGEEA